MLFGLSVCLLWRNVYLELTPIFRLGCLFFDIELHEPLVYFGNRSPVDCKVCRYFRPFRGLCFILFMVSIAVQKLSSLIRSHLFFVFTFIPLGGEFKKDTAVIYVKECSAYVLL